MNNFPTNYQIFTKSRNVPKEIQASHLKYNIWHQIDSTFFAAVPLSSLVFKQNILIQYGCHSVYSLHDSVEIAELYSSPIIRHTCRRLWPTHHIFKEGVTQSTVIHSHEYPCFVVAWYRDILNYYHLLFDVCPKLEVIAGLGKEWQSYQIVFIGEASSLLDDVFAHLYPDLISRIKFVNPGRHRFAVAAFPVTLQPSYMDIYSINNVRIRILKAASSNSEPAFNNSHDSASSSRKIVYLRRGIGLNGRGIANEKELEYALYNIYGVISVACGSIPVIEQWKQVSSADIVISPHGAALSNIIACKAGATVIELLPENYTPATIWFIAVILGLRHFRHIYRTNIDSKCHVDALVDVIGELLRY